MLKTLLVCITLLLTGCSSQGADFAAVIKDLQNKCETNISIEATANAFGNSATVKCDKIKKE